MSKATKSSKGATNQTLRLQDAKDILRLEKTKLATVSAEKIDNTLKIVYTLDKGWYMYEEHNEI